MPLFMYYRDSSLDNMISVTDMYPSCVLSESAFTPFLSKYFISSYVRQVVGICIMAYYQMNDKMRSFLSGVFLSSIVTWYLELPHVYLY